MGKIFCPSVKGFSAFCCVLPKAAIFAHGGFFMLHLIFIYFPWGILAMIAKCSILHTLGFYLVMV